MKTSIVCPFCQTDEVYVTGEIELSRSHPDTECGTGGGLGWDISLRCRAAEPHEFQFLLEASGVGLKTFTAAPF